MWNMFMAVVGVICALMGLYLVTRFRRFSFIGRIGEKRRALAWCVSAVPVGLVGCFAFMNVTAMAVVLIHLTLIWAVSDTVGAVVNRLRHRKRQGRYWAGAAALLVAAVYLGLGWFFAHHVYRTDYEFETEKDLGHVRIVAISDTHLGITQDGESFREVVRRVGETDPDAVVIVGDFVDDDTPREDMIEACKALGELETRYGVYFAYGNHDNGYFGYRDFTPGELRDNLTANGVVILEDESVLLGDSFYIVGRQDRSAWGRAEASELTRGLDRSKYIVMLDHQPNDYENEARSGADLVISGHTHGGHIFPAGLIGLAMGANDRVYGTERRGETDFVVTSGVSGWAIPFKTGAISEFVVIDIDG